MLRAPVAVKRRDRHLSAAEFAALVPVLQTRAAGYTAARRFAALAPAIDIRLHWHHLDLDRGHWARPARHGKPAMRVALPPPALALLRQMPRGEAKARVFPHTTPHAAIMLFLLLTLARRDEAAAARWANIDLDRGHWTIPRTKNDQPHTVPLSDQAVALLRALGPRDADALGFRRSDPGPGLATGTANQRRSPRRPGSANRSTATTCAARRRPRWATSVNYRMSSRLRSITSSRPIRSTPATTAPAIFRSAQRRCSASRTC